MGLVMSLSDHIVALNFGSKIAEGTPAQVRSHPALVQAYLGGAQVEHRAAPRAHATARMAEVTQ
jgi:ABC-type hemin transport system ATPase subunit